jgi:hypothetical protein
MAVPSYAGPLNVTNAGIFEREVRLWRAVRQEKSYTDKILNI